MDGRTRRTVGWISSEPLGMKSNRTNTTAMLSAAYENRFWATGTATTVATVLLSRRIDETVRARIVACATLWRWRVYNRGQNASCHIRDEIFFATVQNYMSYSCRKWISRNHESFYVTFNGKIHINKYYINTK